AVREFRAGTAGSRERLVRLLLDAVGIGRVMFRNTRARLGGFPERRVLPAPLSGDDPTAAKTAWLAGLLEQLPENEKALVIASTREAAEELAESLRDATGTVAALFHEDLTLIQRDRNAAAFAEADGARGRVCSETGSAGRNCQLARQLAL